MIVQRGCLLVLIVVGRPAHDGPRRFVVAAEPKARQFVLAKSTIKCRSRRFRSVGMPAPDGNGGVPLELRQRRRFGYRRLFVLLRQRGETSGTNRIIGCVARKA